jgi:hypothetical protein
METSREPLVEDKKPTKPIYPTVRWWYVAVGY